MVGKFATILGPLLMGTVALWVGNRWSIASLLLLFGGGLWLLAHVRENSETAGKSERQ
jgi:MFS transporter, UMF1 family